MSRMTTTAKRRGAALTIPLLESARKRFNAKVAIAGPDDCWLWMGTRLQNRDRSPSYGEMEIARRKYKAHRLAMMFHTGAIIPTDVKVLHRCDTQACVNPGHLWLGTQADNVADMHQKGRARQRSLRGEASPSAKLSEADVRFIRGSGHGPMHLARIFNVSHSTICEIRSRAIWRHVE